MTRSEAEKHIRNIYGAPGGKTMNADAAALDLFIKMGLDCLTDEGVVELARIQMKQAGVRLR